MLDTRYIAVSFVAFLCVMVVTAQETTLEEYVVMDTTRCVATTTYQNGSKKDEKKLMTIHLKNDLPHQRLVNASDYITILSMKTILAKNNHSMLKHPSYSLDLNSCDFFSVPESETRAERDEIRDSSSYKRHSVGYQDFEK
ncbi:hypothetical protein NPIL_368611 [Nephila pilipes]|uniref:Uncharacterized protein n=1 Tax=Nephila pilipes TaxID=299642 RepID=A0A8X6TKS1_NEPPI|nr:hypothetical protein NPIL_368611 [Nephila pilipes]